MKNFLYILIALLKLLFAAPLAAASTRMPDSECPQATPSHTANSECPEASWFQDAKFGIWAHWGPQCVEETGDWMGRQLYMENHWQSAYHREHYGHPSVFGFKDLLPLFRGEHWQPDSLVLFYKSVGAQYFFAMANHHDNYDLWDSQYQPWNSLAIGPHRDILAEWAAAAAKANLPFGLSFHADHAWTWYETSRRHDLQGPLAGIPYDGHLTLADSYALNPDSTPLWWRGLDPQQLYAQQHDPSEGFWSDTALWHQWEWGGGAALPSDSFQHSFFLRSLDAIHRYRPDLVYFDATVVPFYPVSNIGWQILDSLYQQNPQAVAFGKHLSPAQQQRLTLDVERAAPDSILPLPWQSCTCLGDWHYSRGIYDAHAYKSAATVARLLFDIVSKNGNLLLSVPMRADGTIDDQETAILQEFGQWWRINQEAILASRPWHTYGESASHLGDIDLLKLSSDASRASSEQGLSSDAILASDESFASVQGLASDENLASKAILASEVRFTHKGNVIYAAPLAWPASHSLCIHSLARKQAKVKRVELLGHGPVPYKQTRDGLIVCFVSHNAPIAPLNAIFPVLKITTK